MKPRLTTLGDSFTQGHGDDPLPGGWTARLAELLGVAAGRTRNLGAFGATTQDVVERQLAAALVNKAPMIGLNVGVNDLISDYEPDRFRRNVELILGTLAGPNTTVFTATYPPIPRIAALPPAFRELVGSRFTEANDVVRAATGRHGVLLLDIARDPHWLTPELWSDDDLHPSPSGHRHFAGRMAELLAGAVGTSAHTGRWAG
ncbi:SGNH/GDSL hydrolase family protein [Saccharothrix longispora]|uniref:SGNH/GDSL hydrolase family protein n=1 Tax=Saccharothrix longispora TaxID=33920 RepID=UPI0028FD5413|nr:SGNH/GDSL hydrolase family protein [Saccharothrix longispora]MBY8850204.1 SGNH/GDSL hydrolase family protein [Saccharothrix sp. MB29]MDU0292844.1 SGNH/GDSL hydrolase family protein [Saccharothrix longispora]